MEHAAVMTHLSGKGLTYTIICDLAETWYQEAKHVGKWPPATHAKDSKAPPSSFTQAKVHTLVQCFQKGLSTPNHMKRAMKSVNGCTFIGDPSACHLSGLLPTQWQCTLIAQLPLSETPMPNFWTLMPPHGSSISMSTT